MCDTEYFEDETIDYETSDPEWEIACLNVDLSLKFHELNEAKKNFALLDGAEYYRELSRIQKDIAEIHKKIIDIAIPFVSNSAVENKQSIRG